MSSRSRRSPLGSHHKPATHSDGRATAPAPAGSAPAGTGVQCRHWLCSHGSSADRVRGPLQHELRRDGRLRCDRHSSPQEKPRARLGLRSLESRHSQFLGRGPAIHSPLYGSFAAEAQAPDPRRRCAGSPYRLDGHRRRWDHGSRSYDSATGLMLAAEAWRLMQTRAMCGKRERSRRRSGRSSVTRRSCQLSKQSSPFCTAHRRQRSSRSSSRGNPADRGGADDDTLPHDQLDRPGRERAQNTAEPVIPTQSETRTVPIAITRRRRTRSRSRRRAMPGISSSLTPRSTTSAHTPTSRPTPCSAPGRPTPMLDLQVIPTRQERFELPTFGSVDRRSIQLSYWRRGPSLADAPPRRPPRGGRVALGASGPASAPPGGGRTTR